MRIYDISQEVFGCVVFPGDPAPEKKVLALKKNEDVCNLSAFSMCAHNGTHIDAPYHFIDEGKTVDKIELSKVVGMCYVAEHDGELSGSDAEAILQKAKQVNKECAKRVLIKGKTVVTLDAAKYFANEHILLIGNESQTVGPETAPLDVHMTLLSENIVLLEGIRLSDVPQGAYFLNAAPICLGGADGAPCRAILVECNCES